MSMEKGGMVGRYRTRKSLEALVKTVYTEMGGGGSGDEDFHKKMVGSLYLYGGAVTNDNIQLRATCETYIPARTPGPDGSVSSFRRFIWRYDLISSDARLRSAGDSLMLISAPSLALGSSSGTSLVPPRVGVQTVSWVGGTFRIRAINNTSLRDGDRPSFNLFGSDVLDLRYLDGSIPQVPYAGSWRQTHAW